MKSGSLACSHTVNVKLVATQALSISLHLSVHKILYYAVYGKGKSQHVFLVSLHVPVCR